VERVKTYSAKPHEIERRWFIVDATDQVLGRLATRIATVIRGKHKPTFTPHTDVGDFVIVVNAEKVKLTGAKLDKKLFRRHTGYPGGLVEIPYRRLLETHPERAIEQAVRGMLPKGRLGRRLRHKVKVYKGTDHPHSSQKPEPLDAQGPIPVYVGPEAPPGKRKQKPKKTKPAAEAASKAKPARKPTKRKPTAKKSKPKASAAKTEQNEPKEES
jgi:large subunit ribosomal protein L13